MAKIGKKLIIWIVVGVVVAGIIGVAIYLLNSFLPRPMKIDWESIEKSETNVVLLSADDARNATGAPALVKLDADGRVISSEWKVLQFTDMHLTHELKTTNDTIAHFIAALNEEKPDFVVLTGDIVTRLGAKVRLKQLSEIFETAGIYWAYVLGNHEGDSDPYTVSRLNTMKTVETYDHCLVDTSVKKTAANEDVWGYCNFVVNLLGADFDVVQSMIFLDSGNEISDEDYAAFSKERPEYREHSYDYIKESQMTWSEEQIKNVTNNFTKEVKTMFFFHIPLEEYRNYYFVKQESVEKGKLVLLSEHPDYLANADEKTIEKLKSGSVKLVSADLKKVEGSEVVVNGEVVGYFVKKDGWNVIGDTRSFERPCSSEYNNGMYARLAAMGAYVNGVFCGHDHINNTILYEPALASPVYLCYGTCSGRQGYNLKDDGLSETEKYEDRGYSVIEIKADGKFSFADVLYGGAPVYRIVDGEPA